MKTTLLILLLIMFSLDDAQGFFDFQSYSANSFTWDFTDQNPQYTFTVDFRSYCNFGCVGQDYRLVLANANPGRQSPVRSVPDNYEADELKEYVQSISYQQNSNQGSWLPGEWSHGTTGSFFVTQTNSTVTGTFTLTLNSANLRRLPAGTKTLSFYIGGQDMYGTLHLDSIQIEIPVIIPERVQITGLSDVSLHAASLAGGNLDSDQQVCVFSNTGKVKVDFDGRTVPGDDFQLAKSDGCTSNEHCVPYRMRVRTESEDWLTFRRKGQRENDSDNEWTVSRDENCSDGTLMTLRVRLKRDDIESAETGVYIDTMTVTVAPL